MNAQDYSRMHALYCLLTGLDVPYVEMMHSSDWYQFCKRYDADDLRVTIAHIKKRYASEHSIMLSMLRFTYLVRQLDTFAELLAEARAALRPPTTEREKVLAATGRTECKTCRPPQKAGDVANRVLRGDEFVAAMKKLRESIE